MPPSGFGYPGGAALFILALLCTAVLGMVIGPLIGAVILRVAAKLFDNLTFTFGSAYITALSAFLLSFTIVFVILLLLAPVWATLDLSVRGFWLIMLLILLVVGFIVHAGMISNRHERSWEKGMGLAICMLFPSMLTPAVIFIIVALVFRTFL